LKRGSETEEVLVLKLLRFYFRNNTFVTCWKERSDGRSPTKYNISYLERKIYTDFIE